MKNGFPAPNKELAKTKNNHLTGKAPYKFESCFLQRRVQREPDFRETDGAPLAARAASPRLRTAGVGLNEIDGPLFRPLRHNGKRQEKRRGMDPDAIDRIVRKYAGESGPLFFG
jgi:hypothetical protein